MTEVMRPVFTVACMEKAPTVNLFGEDDRKEISLCIQLRGLNKLYQNVSAFLSYFFQLRVLQKKEETVLKFWSMLLRATLTSDEIPSFFCWCLKGDCSQHILSCQ